MSGVRADVPQSKDSSLLARLADPDEEMVEAALDAYWDRRDAAERATPKMRRAMRAAIAVIHRELSRGGEG